MLDSDTHQTVITNEHETVEKLLQVKPGNALHSRFDTFGLGGRATFPRQHQ